jgi:pimeloyl-ACP methyl ester carboxylesterase
MPIARINGIDIEYYVEGRGPPLLMITPLAWNADMWGEPFLAPLREHFAVIRFSNRGTGLSAKPEGDYSIELMSEDAAGVLRHIGTEPAQVFGASMGGLVAQQLALDHPDLVDRLVLGCTICGWQRGVRPSLDTEPEAATLKQPQSNAEFIGAMLSLLTTPQFVEDSTSFVGAIVRIMTDRPTSPQVAAKQEAAVNAFNSYKELPKLRGPLLIIHGEVDRMAPVGNASILHERIPNSRLKIIPGAGHAFMWQFPEESARAIVEFSTVISTAV